MVERRSQRPSWPIISGLSAVIVVSAGVAAWIGWQGLPWTSPDSPASNPTLGQASPGMSASAAAIATGKLDIYWLQASQNDVSLAAKSTQVSQPNATPEALLQAGLEKLLAGPADKNSATTIPQGTRLNTVAIKADGIHVDLSKEFMAGGGSSSMQGRLGQVVYTATSLDPQAKVWLSIGGQPLKVLGGEGLIVEQPTSRQDFQQNFSL
jgi:spore germination protein GerM